MKDCELKEQRNHETVVFKLRKRRYFIVNSTPHFNFKNRATCIKFVYHDASVIIMHILL